MPPAPLCILSYLFMMDLPRLGLEAWTQGTCEFGLSLQKLHAGLIAQLIMFPGNPDGIDYINQSITGYQVISKQFPQAHVKLLGFKSQLIIGQLFLNACNINPQENIS